MGSNGSEASLGVELNLYLRIRKELCRASEQAPDNRLALQNEKARKIATGVAELIERSHIELRARVNNLVGDVTGHDIHDGDSNYTLSMLSGYALVNEMMPIIHANIAASKNTDKSKEKGKGKRTAQENHPEGESKRKKKDYIASESDNQSAKTAFGADEQSYRPSMPTQLPIRSRASPSSTNHQRRCRPSRRSLGRDMRMNYKFE